MGFFNKKKSYRLTPSIITEKKLFNEIVDEDKENEPDNNLISVTVSSPAVTCSVFTPSKAQQFGSSPSEILDFSKVEYFPNFADETTYSSNINLSTEIPEISQIVLDSIDMKPMFCQDISENSLKQENICGENNSEQNINVPNSREFICQIDKNLETQVLDNKNKETTKKRDSKKRDYCIFCDTEVLKFSRHILRHHTQETEVQQILAYNVNDKRRKALFKKLRNTGNFVKSSIANDNVIPVRQSATDLPSVSTYLPCKYCKGFYKKKFLSRHVKKCPHNDNKSKRTNAVSEGQSLFSAYKDNDLLRKEVFPIMRGDAISLTAKTDPLICAVAKRYLKSHGDKQFRLVASRKMRQLALLLTEIKKKKPVKNLLQALEPANFDIIAECTKIVARYDPKTATYGAPSLASHMGTELKDCIDVAYNMSLKFYHRESEETVKLKALKEIITTEWRYEVSTIANNDLQQKRWNKPTLIPLAEDLTLMKKYLYQKADEFMNILNQNPQDINAFKTLQDICYVQILLLNRRRVGELQRMTVHSYTSNIDNERSTEFDGCISESEKVLMRSFKRVVIKGKRGRGVPVLFTDGMVRTTNLLLKVRANFVQESNIYLFANTQNSSSINGAKAIYTHVRRAGVQNASALTSTKLRKHLATMSQVINLSEQDLEQLASFMGHTSDIHKSCYRLPNDVYQMAKVSKLLILNEKGQASKYKGKTLDEIEIDLNVVQEENSDDEETNDDNEQAAVAHNESSDIDITNKKKPNTSQKKNTRVLEPWSVEQKEVTLAFFERHLKRKIAPKKFECLQLQEENPGLFNNKSWEKIKIFVVNKYNKN